MAEYSFVGYDPDVITVSFSFFGSTLTLDADYDPDTDRRIFNVVDEPGPPPLVNGDPDNGTDFNGDRFNNEVGDDTSQQGTVTDLDGNNIPGLIPGGDIYLEEKYTLTNPGGGTIDVYRVEVNGVLAGYVTSEPLVPDVDYSITFSNVTPDNAPDTTDPDAIVDVPCFVQGTLIQTPQGARSVETLNVGDLVVTASGDAKEIRWIGCREVDVTQANKSHLKPIRIAKGALAKDVPSRDLCVSPNHRVLVSGTVLELLFAESEALVPAKFLTGLAGVEVVTEATCILYHHFIFDQHEVVISNGALTESLYPGDMALNGLESGSRNELRELFPGIFDPALADYGQTAARVLRKHEADILVSRYGDNAGQGLNA